MINTNYNKVHKVISFRNFNLKDSSILSSVSLKKTTYFTLSNDYRYLSIYGNIATKHLLEYHFLSQEKTLKIQYKE